MNRILKYYIFRSVSEVYGLFASLNNGIRVLLYHKITSDVSQEERITRRFEMQLRKLKERLLPDPIHAMETTLTNSNSGIIISFDDGYSEIITKISPILEEMAIPHILYISPGLLKRSRGKYLSRSDLQKLALNCKCFIGAHGLTHRNLRGCNSVEMRHEILTSKLMLEDLISREVKSFSFPYGAVTYDAIRVLQELGFTSAVTSRTGIINSGSNPFLLNRTEIAPTEEDCMFNLKIKGAFDWHHLRQYDLNEIQRQLTRLSKKPSNSSV